jgi:hypothetical protein
MQRQRINAQEERVYRRVPLGVEVQIVTGEGSPLSGLARDISLGGLFVESESRLSFGDEITVLVQLPETKDTLRLSGVVRWTNSAGFGLQFGSLGASATHAITRWVSRPTT